MYIQKRKIYADEELETTNETTTDIDIDNAATDLLFETEDVAELLAEVTGQDVEVTTDDDTEDVTFAVGDEEFTVSPEGDEEILQSVQIPKRKVKAAKRFAKSNVKANSSRLSNRSRSIKRVSK